MGRKRTTVFLDEATLQELQIVSEHTHMPMAEMVRQGVQLWLDRRKRGKRNTIKRFDRLAKTVNR